ncbi:SRPBCC family protein [Luteimonas aquatica]|uniref:SRPBCC family protein n=1 Tax=Luteimonas aquatica TaxID=450364 RepID=UPI001F5AB0C7|nr:SRPBCC family protein [Luteimonas aquatica]
MNGRLASSRPYPSHVLPHPLPTTKDFRMNADFDRNAAVRTAPDAVRIERTLPGPIERVWAYLTEDEKLGQWLASGIIEPRVGGKVELLFLHSRLSDEPGPAPARYADMEPNGYRHRSRVTAWDPPRVLAYTWGEQDDASEVRFELNERGDDVLLTVTHARLPNHGELVGVSGGWHAHLDVLADRLHGRAPPNFWKRHAPLDAEYQKRFAAG